MSDLYGRVASASLLKEATANTAVIPTNYFLLNDETLSTSYEVEPTMQIAANRSKFIRQVKKTIPAPVGDLKLSIEPLQFGHFLNGVYGGVTTGVYFQIGYRLMAGTVTGTPVAGATLLQATSGATGTVASLVTGNAYFDLSAITGAFDATHTVTGTNPDTTTFTFTPSQVLNATALLVGDTITGGSSSKTATVNFINVNEGYLLATSPSGAFTVNEKITGTGGGVMTMINMATTVYGHVATLPQNSLTTYSLQINYQNAAIRYCGTRYLALDPVNQANNVMSATIKCMSQSQFRHAAITTGTAGAGGTQVLPCDQTQGLVVGDIVKVFRPSTGLFIDLNGAGIKTNTITAIVPGVSISMTVLTTTTAIGDLIVLAPQTPTYTTGQELAWIGSSLGQLATSVGNGISSNFANSVMEDFSLSVEHDFEARWQANGQGINARFPAALIQKGLSAKGSFTCYYQDETFYALLRANTAQAFRIKAVGANIGVTTIPFEVRFTFPQVIFMPFQTNVTNDKVVEQTIPFQVYTDATQGYYARVLLVTTTSSF